MTDRDPRVSYKFERTWDSESDYCAKKAMQRYDEIKRLQLENAELKAALQEQEERSKGCEFCNTIYDDWDEGDLAPREFRIEGNKLWYRDTKFHAWVSKTIMLCPMCGRKLKGEQE